MSSPISRASKSDQMNKIGNTATLLTTRHATTTTITTSTTMTAITTLHKVAFGVYSYKIVRNEIKVKRRI